MSKAVNLGTLADDISVSNGKANLSGISLTPGSAPSSPIQGDVYLDSSDNQLKIYNGTVWENIVSGPGITAIGGTVTDITDGGVNYRVHTFTTSGTFTVLGKGVKTADVLIVAGGGGGGADNAGGGGAGGLLYYGTETPKTPNGSQVTLSPGNYSIVVGAGGAGHAGTSDGDSGPGGVNGSNSSAFGYTAIGGGNGASAAFKSSTGGGSGGGGEGAQTHFSGSSGTNGQGNSGGNGSNGGGGGGGGSAAAGQNGNVRATQHGGAGGAGLQYSISGSAQFYAAGGDGGNENSVFVQYSRPSGIGGQSPANGSSRPTDAVTNTGSGGGGGTHTCVMPAGNGSSGIVIIRYEI